MVDGYSVAGQSWRLGRIAHGAQHSNMHTSFFLTDKSGGGGNPEMRQNELLPRNVTII